MENIGDQVKIINNVYVPVNDKSEHKVVKLNNDLQIMFIQNDKENFSSAYMYVGVGNIDNPPNIDGLAHFLEHMLFMGSDKYPGGTYFHNKVYECGGTTNAFTDDNSTHYYFSTPNRFIEILEIFSRFFIKPSFDLKYVKKEISAVDSEHNKNKGNDGWRIMNITKRFIIDGVNDRFSTGNNDTLLRACDNNVTILRNELINFYEKFYSSDRMILFITHNVIDDSFITTVSNFFGEIPRRQTDFTDNTARVNNYEDMYELIKVETVIEYDTLIIYWLIDCSEYFVNNLSIDSIDILSHILGHEGVGSLHNVLSDMGYITSLTAGKEYGFKKNSLYSLKMNLTRDGFNKWEYILYIVDCYINYLFFYDNLTDEYFNQFYEELKNITRLQLKTMEPLEGLAKSQVYAEIYGRKHIDLKYLPIFMLLSDTRENRHINYKKILKQLRFNNMKVIISSPNIMIDDDELMIDKYYFTLFNHLHVKIDQCCIDKYKHILKNMSYPRINKYLSNVNDIKIIDPIKMNEESFIRLSSKSNNIYYLKQGNTYDTYNNVISITIDLEALRTYDSNIYTMIMIYLLYIEKLKNTELYQFRMAKIITYMTVEGSALVINVYSCSNIIDKIFETFMNWYYNDKLDEPLDESIYDNVYYDLRSHIISYKYSNPYTMIIPEFKKMVNDEHVISNDQIMHSLPMFSPDKMKLSSSDINYKNFNKIAVDLMSKGKIMGMFGGSIMLGQVKNIISCVDSTIRRMDDTHRIKYVLDPNKFPSNKTIINHNPNNIEKSVGYGIYIKNIKEVSEVWKIEKPFIMMLVAYLSDKFSSNVRTERELGYIAYCTLLNVNESNNNDLYIIFIAQSTRDDIYNIVADYIDNIMMHDIESITDEQFNTMKQGTLNSLSRKYINIMEDIDSSFSCLTCKLDDYRTVERFDRKLQMYNALDLYGSRTKFVEFVRQFYNNNIRSVIMINPLKN